MKNIKKDTEKEGQNNENKLYLQTFMEIIEKELLMLLQICKERFSVPRNNQRNQGNNDNGNILLINKRLDN